jgi:hypothetical protein
MNLVVLARHQPTEVDLDLSIGWTKFEREALSMRASTADLVRRDVERAVECIRAALCGQRR